MTKNLTKSWTRRITIAAVLTAVLASGGIASNQHDAGVQAGDGPGRCC